MQKILATIADAKAGEISGWSIAKWLNQSGNSMAIREGLRGLVNRGLIVMHPKDDLNDEWRKQFPDRLKATYSLSTERIINPKEGN
jgi:hypothetical protein